MEQQVESTTAQNTTADESNADFFVPSGVTMKWPDKVPVGVAKKVCQVMSAVGSVPKNGYNRQQNYNYIADGDVTAKVQPLLAKYGLAILPRMTSRKLTPVPSASGKTAYKTEVTMEYILIDTDSGDQCVCPMEGESNDSGDKGTWKAMTNIRKYFLLQLFVMGADADAEDDGGSYGQGQSYTQGNANNYQQNNGNYRNENRSNNGSNRNDVPMKVLTGGNNNPPATNNDSATNNEPLLVTGVIMGNLADEVLDGTNCWKVKLVTTDGQGDFFYLPKNHPNATNVEELAGTGKVVNIMLKQRMGKWLINGGTGLEVQPAAVTSGV